MASAVEHPRCRQGMLGKCKNNTLNMHHKVFNPRFLTPTISFWIFSHMVTGLIRGPRKTLKSNPLPPTTQTKSRNCNNFFVFIFKFTELLHVHNRRAFVDPRMTESLDAWSFLVYLASFLTGLGWLVVLFAVVSSHLWLCCKDCCLSSFTREGPWFNSRAHA